MANEKLTERLCGSARLMVVLMLFFGCIVTYILRLNMGIAMVCMVKSRDTSADSANRTNYRTGNESRIEVDSWKVKSTFGDDDRLNTSVTHEEPEETGDRCAGSGQFSNTGDAQEGEFEWDKRMQGFLLAAFFYGYLVCQIPAGWLCNKIGAKRVLCGGLGALSLLCLVIPPAARLNPFCLMALRVVQGMFGSVTFPASHQLLGAWAPPTERGYLMALAYSGLYVGTLLNYPMGGFLCHYVGGWPSIFYVAGALGVAVVTVMLFTVYDGPGVHPRITLAEKGYLARSWVGIGNQGATKNSHVPWAQIRRSKPVLAICIAHFCSNFGLYTLVINMPLYMKDVLKFDIQENGLMSALPYACTLFINVVVGKLLDVVRKRRILSPTGSRKLFNSIGMVFPGCCMLLISVMSCRERYWAVALLCLSQATAAFAYSGGFFNNHVDLAPQYAAILMGITNMVGNIPGVLTPTLVGYFTPNGTREEWFNVFCLGALLYLLGAISYVALASGERQKWSYSKEQLEELRALREIELNDNRIAH